MLCTVCGSENARKFLRKTADGRELTLTLCKNCYARLYPAQESGDLFTAFVGNAQRGASDKACRSCGTTLADFRRTGLLGCADCYAAFREELVPTLRFVQGKLSHTGKSPSGFNETHYDAVLGLIPEQAELRQRIEEAEHARDEAEVNRLKALLEAVNRKIYGGEAI